MNKVLVSWLVPGSILGLEVFGGMNQWMMDLCLSVFQIKQGWGRNIKTHDRFENILGYIQKNMYRIIYRLHTERYFDNNNKKIGASAVVQ